MNNVRQQVLMMAKNINNPIMNNMINLAEKGDVKGVENVARNLMKQRGLDLDELMAKFNNLKK